MSSCWADFRSYVDAQEEAHRPIRIVDERVRMSIINTAKSGHFSTDRTMEEYNRDIWRLEPVVAPPVAPA
ncbi:glycogen/starch/alpha-glucan phosphorylase [endosymbiont of Lamellibrachia barhami]|uniref:glycogen/starch/alpha-glucan phosphorylase n=1 Tax=endosymbiont of Lamellibrachia barhami TaxID=205975 RepID=UPI0015B0EE23